MGKIKDIEIISLANSSKSALITCVTSFPFLQGSPLEKSGKFGKIQILDSGETRLVIGDCFFRLTSPGLAPYSTVSYALRISLLIVNFCLLIDLYKLDISNW